MLTLFLEFYHPKNQKKKKKKKIRPPEGKKKKTKPKVGETQPWVSVAGRRLATRWPVVLPARPSGDPLQRGFHPSSSSSFLSSLATQSAAVGCKIFLCIFCPLSVL
jgi:hypothetical protein